MRRCVLALGAFAAACSSSAPASEAPVVPRPTITLSETERTKPASCNASWLAGSTGRVTTDGGEILVGASVAYCAYHPDSAVCLPWVKTTEGGWYTVLVREPNRCMERLSVRVIPPEGRRLSDAYCAPALSAIDGVLDLARDLRVYSLDAPTSLPPRGDAAQTRTVSFAGGLELTFAPDDLVEGDLYDKLSAAPVTDGERPCFLPPELALDGLYAFGPAMNVSVFAGKPKVKFKLPNPKGLPEGAAVELFVLGGSGTQLDDTRAIEEGSFVSIGAGRVREGRVVPDPGSELPALTVVGYRRK
ncbi:MAG: hypothetical protein KF819_04925 [Labilithrix sp.]|nr:hypothetical protein [Labilithrix sp.]